MSKFVPMHTMTSEQAHSIVEKSLTDRPRIHIEPVVFGDQANPIKQLAAIHVQIDDAHAVLTGDDVEQFFMAFRAALQMLRKPQ